MTPTCRTCHWLDGTRCRRFPPTPVADVTGSEVGEQGDYHMEVSTSAATLWPEVKPDDWCGEYRSI